MSFSCFADWFRHHFPKESSDIKHTLKLPQDKQLAFFSKFGDLILKYHKLIPKLAGVIKELYVVDSSILKSLYKANGHKVEACIAEGNKARENDVRFWLSMFEMECYLVNVGIYAFSYYIEAIATQLMCRNEANDIILMFTIQRCFYRLRKEVPSFFNICMNYVKRIKKDRRKEIAGDLSFDETLVDPGLKRMMAGIAAGNALVNDRPCLTWNALVQAKFFLKSILECPAEVDTSCSLLDSLSASVNNDFQLGFGWIIFHLNTLCAAKLNEFYPEGRYYPENVEGEGSDEAQALLKVIMKIRDLGYLSEELKELLAFYQIVAIM